MHTPQEVFGLTTDQVLSEIKQIHGPISLGDKALQLATGLQYKGLRYLTWFSTALTFASFSETLREIAAGKSVPPPSLDWLAAASTAFATVKYSYIADTGDLVFEGVPIETTVAAIALPIALLNLTLSEAAYFLNEGAKQAQFLSYFAARACPCSDSDILSQACGNISLTKSGWLGWRCGLRQRGDGFTCDCVPGADFPQGVMPCQVFALASSFFDRAVAKTPNSNFVVKLQQADFDKAVKALVDQMVKDCDANPECSALQSPAQPPLWLRIIMFPFGGIPTASAKVTSASGGTKIDPATQDVTFSLTADDGTAVTAAVSHGSFTSNASSTSFTFKDKTGKRADGIVAMKLQRRGADGFVAALKMVRPDLVDVFQPVLTTALTIGAQTFSLTLPVKLPSPRVITSFTTTTRTTSTSTSTTSTTSSTTTTTLPATVIAGPIVNPTNGHTYYLLAPAGWTASEAEAVGLGGHLATIRSQAEEDYVYNTFSSFGGQNHALWIGFTDAGQPATNPRQFYWASGEGVTYRHWAPPPPPGVTGAQEPDCPNEHYTQIFDPGDTRGGYWNDCADAGTCSQVAQVSNGVAEVP